MENKRGERYERCVCETFVISEGVYDVLLT